MLSLHWRRLKGMHLIADLGWEPRLIGLRIGSLFIGFVWWHRDLEKCEACARAREEDLES